MFQRGNEFEDEYRRYLGDECVDASADSMNKILDTIATVAGTPGSRIFLYHARLSAPSSSSFDYSMIFENFEIDFLRFENINNKCLITVMDTKASSKLKPGHQAQVALYSEMLARLIATKIPRQYASFNSISSTCVKLPASRYEMSIVGEVVTPNVLDPSGKSYANHKFLLAYAAALAKRVVDLFMEMKYKFRRPFIHMSSRCDSCDHVSKCRAEVGVQPFVSKSLLIKINGVISRGATVSDATLSVMVEHDVPQYIIDGYSSHSVTVSNRPSLSIHRYEDVNVLIDLHWDPLSRDLIAWGVSVNNGAQKSSEVKLKSEIKRNLTSDFFQYLSALLSSVSFKRTCHCWMFTDDDVASLRHAIKQSSDQFLINLFITGPDRLAVSGSLSLPQPHNINVISSVMNVVYKMMYVPSYGYCNVNDALHHLCDMDDVPGRDDVYHHFVHGNDGDAMRHMIDKRIDALSDLLVSVRSRCNRMLDGVAHPLPPITTIDITYRPRAEVAYIKFNEDLTSKCDIFHDRIQYAETGVLPSLMFITGPAHYDVDTGLCVASLTSGSPPDYLTSEHHERSPYAYKV